MNRDRVAWVGVVLSLLAVWPVWAPQGPPTQDGPSHVYNAHVLLERQRDTPTYARRYEARWALAPNLAGNAALVGLGAGIGVFWAERLLVAGAVLCFALGAARLLRGPDGAASPAAWPATLVVAGHPLWMGFYSYSLGLALVPWAWAHAREDRPARLAGLALLALAAHPVPVAACAVGRRPLRPPSSSPTGTHPRPASTGNRSARLSLDPAHLSRRDLARTAAHPSVLTPKTHPKPTAPADQQGLSGPRSLPAPTAGPKKQTMHSQRVDEWPSRRFPQPRRR